MGNFSGIVRPKSIGFYANLVYIVIVLFWKPLQSLVLHVDGAGRTIYVLILLILVTNLSKKKFVNLLNSGPQVYWLIWLIYAFFNSLLQGYDNSPKSVFLLELLAPFVLLIAILNIEDDKLKLILRLITVSLYVNIIIVLLNLGSFVDFSLRDIDSFPVNANEFGVTSVVLMITLYLSYVLEKRKSVIYLIVLQALPIFGIVISGSRNAFAGFVVFFSIVLLFGNKRASLSTLFVKLFGIALMLFMVYYILNNTVLGDRVLTTSDQAESLGYKTGTIFDKLGDRGLFYILGYDVFKENPFFGVGLYGFMNYSDFAQHSEYMINLSELGLVGTFLFVLFYYSLSKQVFVLRTKLVTQKSNYKIKIVMIASLLLILVMGVSTRIFNSIYFFVILGLLIRFSMNKYELNTKKSIVR